MMVHILHAPVASRAVVASLRLENVTDLTVASSFLLWVVEIETPEDRGLSRVHEISCKISPDCH